MELYCRWLNGHIPAERRSDETRRRNAATMEDLIDVDLDSEMMNEPFITMASRVVPLIEEFDETNEATAVHSLLSQPPVCDEIRLWLTKFEQNLYSASFCDYKKGDAAMRIWWKAARSNWKSNHLRIALECYNKAVRYSFFQDEKIAKLLIEREKFLNHMRATELAVELEDMHLDDNDLMPGPIAFGERVPPNRVDRHPPVYQGESYKLPNASTAVSRRYTEDEVPYIIAVADIPKNSVLFSERPFSATKLEYDYGNDTCDLCWNIITDTVFPCQMCPSAQYCSMECMQIDSVNIHHYECLGGRMGLWKSLGSSHLALRSLLTGALGDEGLTFGFIEDVCELDFEDADTLMGIVDTSAHGRYKKAYKLSTSMHPMVSLKGFALAAIVMMMYLKDYVAFLTGYVYPRFPNTEPETLDEFVAGMLMRHLIQNVVSGMTVIRLVENNEYIEIGQSIYSSAGLMRHSCEPNTKFSMNEQARFVGVAAIDIPKGTEITHCYMNFDSNQPLKVRRRMLLKKHGFICECPACTREKE